MKQFPISPAFTLHLRVFTIFWLALLPLTLVLHDGLISFVYVLPISYSIINLLIIGDELSNTFGEDMHDIPLNILCAVFLVLVSETLLGLPKTEEELRLVGQGSITGELADEEIATVGQSHSYLSTLMSLLTDRMFVRSVSHLEQLVVVISAVAQEIPPKDVKHQHDRSRRSRRGRSFFLPPPVAQDINVISNDEPEDRINTVLHFGSREEDDVVEYASWTARRLRGVASMARRRSDDDENDDDENDDDENEDDEIDEDDKE